MMLVKATSPYMHWWLANMNTRKLLELPFAEQMLLLDEFTHFLNRGGYSYDTNYVGVPINIKPKDKHLKQATNILNKRIRSR